MESNDMWLVLFVSAKHSGESTKSEWEEASRELSGKFKMGKIFSKYLAKQFGLKSFPTIMYFPSGDKSDPGSNENYKGDITANGIVKWALQRLKKEPIGK